MRNKSFRMYANGLEEAHFFRTVPRRRIFCPREYFAIGGAEINFSGCSLGINNLSYFQQLLQVIKVCNYYLALAREQRMEGQLKISSLSKVPTAAFCHHSLPLVPPGVNALAHGSQFCSCGITAGAAVPSPARCSSPIPVLPRCFGCHSPTFGHACRQGTRCPQLVYNIHFLHPNNNCSRSKTETPNKKPPN